MMRRYFPLLVGLLLAGCGAWRPPSPQKIVLLAPFEGRYREIGYAAIYPARLAMQDVDDPRGLSLLALDDGGSAEIAVQRARALALDPKVALVLVQGYPATAPEVLAAFGDKPVIVIGDWGAQPAENVFILSHPALQEAVMDPRLSILDAASVPAPYLGGDVLGLTQLADLRDDLDGLTLVTSGSLPTDEFRQRILASDPFAVEPNHLSTLTYDAVRLAAESIQTKTPLSTLHYAGLSGVFTFDSAGYWAEAPRHRFTFDG